MTDTIPNVLRELLERCAQYTPTLEKQEGRARALSELRALLSAPSPAGVDGLEVVATAILGGVEYGIGGPELGEIDVELSMGALCRIQEQMVSNEDSVYLDLCSLSDATAIIDGLRGEVELLQRAEKNDAIAYKAALERQDELRTERDEQAQRIGELEGLLRGARELITHGVFEDGVCCCGSSVEAHGFGDGHSPVDALSYFAGQTCERIDAALYAGKEGE